MKSKSNKKLIKEKDNSSGGRKRKITQKYTNKTINWEHKREKQNLVKKIHMKPEMNRRKR